MTTITVTPSLTGGGVPVCESSGGRSAGVDSDGGGDRYAEVVAEHEARCVCGDGGDFCGDFDDFGLSAVVWRDVEATVGVVSALWDVEAGLGRLPLPPGVADALAAVIRCGVAHADTAVAEPQGVDDGVLLGAAAGVRVVQGFADGVLVHAAGSLAHRAGEELLGRKKVSDPGELSVSARERWRAKTKSVVAQELTVLTGVGVFGAHVRVGFALAPPVVVGAAKEALSRGLVDWRGVQEFWQRCARMDVVDAQTVAENVFGPLLAAADEAATTGDAQDGDGQPAGVVRAESWSEFHRRLSREVTRVEGADGAAARERRRAAARRRDVSADIGEDGLSTFTLTAGTASVVAAMERIETIARRARKAGDPRNLGCLRSDTAMALLVHGTLPLNSNAEGDADGSGTCGPKGDSDGAAPNGDHANHGDPRGNGGDSPSASSQQPLVPVTDEVRRIIYGLPSAHVDLIVPLDALTGDAAARGTGAAWARAAGDATTGNLGAGARPVDPGPPPGSGLIGEIPGHGFLTGEHAREVATLPGSTWHRLLTDPVTGHAIERSSQAYRPDKAMVEHVRAVDRFCRAPGCLIPTHRCELDHEQPYGTPGGVTSVANLNAKHPRHHQLKTEQFWASVMDETRQVTWTTLFNRVYTTQAHDHRQYGPAASQGDEMAGHGAGLPQDAPPADAQGPQMADPLSVEDPDMRDQLIYAALCSRTGHDRWLEALDDNPEHPDSSYIGLPLGVFHRRNGRRRNGPPPGQRTPEQLLTPKPDYRDEPVVVTNSEPPPF